MLDLAGHLVGLEAADQCAELLVVSGVEGIKDGLGTLARLVQRGEQGRDVAAAGVLGDHVEAGVGAKAAIHPVVDVAQAGIVQLHGDSEAVVRSSEAEQYGRLVLLGFLRTEALPRHGLGVDGLDLLVGSGAEGDVVQAVIAGATAEGGEKLQPLHKRALDGVGALKRLLADALGELRDIFGEALLVDVDGLVRPEGRANLDGDRRIVGDLPVPFQGIDGVVGGADEGDIGLLDDAAHGERGIVLQLVVAEVPSLLRVFRRKRLVVAEELPQLEVAPVDHWVSDGHLQRLHELEIALIGGLVAGDVLLRHPVGAHDAPLVMVAEVAAVGVAPAEPDLGQIVEAPVFIDLPRRDVAVVVHEGHVFRIVVEEAPSGLGFKQEISVQKCLHAVDPFSV